MFVLVGYGQSSAVRLEVDHLDQAAQHIGHYTPFLQPLAALLAK